MAIVLLVFVIGVSVQAQEWVFPQIGMSNSVNQFDSSRTPVRHLSAIESPPTYWNVPMTPTTLNEFPPSTATHYGQATGQAMPLYAAIPSTHHPTSETCCTSTEQMAKNIAETLNVLRTIAVSLETLNVNLNKTTSTAHVAIEQNLNSTRVSGAEIHISTDAPSTVTEKVPPESN